MRSQLDKLAIVNTSTLSETLTFSVFQEGAEEASRQVITIEDNTAEIENSREIITSRVYDLTLAGVYSDAARTQLRTWADNGTELTFTGYNFAGLILQMEGTIQPNLGFDENLSFRFSSKREGLGSYSSLDGKHTGELSYDLNGLALYDWNEGSTTGLAAGWSKSGGTTTWDSVNGEQDFSTTAGGGNSMSRTIYFPFAKDLTFSVEFTAVTETTGVSIEIEEYDNADTLVDSTSNATITTGRESVTHSCSTSCEYIIVKVNIGQNDSVSFKDAVLGLNGNTTYSEFNT